MKKDIYSTAFIVGFLSFFMSSCTHPDKYNVQINRLDSLSGMADSALEQLRSIDSSKLFSDIQTLNADLGFIGEKNPDTLSRENALALANCSGALSVLQKVQKEIPLLKKGLSLSKIKLEDLKKDLKANAIDDEKVNGFVGAESKIIQSNFNSAMLISTIYSENILQCESNHSVVSALVDSLLNEK